MAKTPTTGGALTPEQLYAHLEPFGQEGDALDQQLKLAEALRGWQPSTPSYGAMAGIGNGLATILNAYTGTRDAKRLRGEQAALFKREQGAAMPFAERMNALVQALRNPSPQDGLEADPYAPPLTSFGL